jgi:hypothetical protein
MMKRKAGPKLRLTVWLYDLLAGVRDVSSPTAMLARPGPFDLGNDDLQNADTPFALG